MLEEIRIRGLGVIEDAVLELSPGLNVLSGETGAGKTMVVTGLGLLFGGRADPGMVGPHLEAASVEGRLKVDPAGPAAARAQESGAELDDDVLILARTVSASGRSRAHVGGRGVPAGTLADLAEWSLAVHGQSEQIRLRQPSRQREALDRFAGDPVAVPLAAYTAAYDELRAVDTELAELTTRARERAREADLLRFGLGEVDAVDPQPGELAGLAVEEDRLGHADALRAAAEQAHALVLGSADTPDEGRDAATLVASARTALEQVGVSDPVLDELAGRLREVGYLLADAAADLASYAASVETDPTRLAVVQDRRAELTRLVRKYAETSSPDTEPVGAVLDWSARAAARLATLDSDDDRISALSARRDELRATLARTAADVSTARTAAADRFAAAVTAELAELAMSNAALHVAIGQLEADAQTDDQTDHQTTGIAIDGRSLAFGPHGVDEVELLLRPHAGAAPRPVQKGASGGELSRVMLAIEVVLAGTDPVPTLVFDEVDAGVGGRAAVEVGRRLSALAKTTQVIVVTHLPQVAAFADQHLVVRKADDGSVTRSGVLALDEAGRLRELSRMLAGQEESATAEAHARELLTLAQSGRT